MLSNRKSLAVLLVLLALFLFGLERVLRLRYEQGNVYPAYSSLRTDPLGAKALYESLGGLRGVDVTRLFQPLEKLGPPRDKALFVLGVGDLQFRNLDEAEYGDLQHFLMGGGRAVFALFPEGRSLTSTNSTTNSPPTQKKTLTDKGSTNGPSRNIGTNESDLDAEFLPVSLEDKFGFKLAATPLLLDEGRTRPEQVHATDTNSALPRLVSWHSAIYFDNLAAPWKVIYSRRGKAVMIERKVGTGSLVLASDSYFVSNEALRNERHPELLAWLVGGCHNIVFDETHLGVQENPSVVMLARKYRLTGLGAGLALVALLFIWRNAASLLPPYEDPIEEAGVVQGRDSATGLVSLLRRSIPPAELLATCVAEWKRCPSSRAGATPERVAAMEGILAEQNALSARERSPVSGYRDVQQVLRTKV